MKEKDYLASDERDEMCESGKNDRKSLLCVCIRTILMEYSTPWKPLRQEWIRRELNMWPYGLTVDRKSLSRELKTLMAVYPTICRSADGYYYDRVGRAA